MTFWAVSSHTTPNPIIVIKYSTIMDIMRQPPHALIKNNSISERIKVMNIIASEIGHVCFKSAIA